jgi:hypothetical protein
MNGTSNKATPIFIALSTGFSDRGMSKNSRLMWQDILVRQGDYPIVSASATNWRK